MAALRDSLTQFVGDVFTSGQFDEQVLLRGVYLTSGTQDGTQIDRLLGAIGRQFGVAPEAVAPPAGRGKAYFVERLLKDVVISESGLAGVNRQLELRSAAWQIGAYAAIVLTVAVGVIALSASYASNRDYLGQVASNLAALRRVDTVAAGASAEAALPRLNAVRAVADAANGYRDDTLWGMRWGLYQRASVGHAARDAYLRELDSVLLPRFATRIRQHVIAYGSEPEKLYEYLKAYLMLGEPRHLDKKHLQWVADLEWGPAEATAGAARRCQPPPEPARNSARPCARARWTRRSWRRHAARFDGHRFRRSCTARCSEPTAPISTAPCAWMSSPASASSRS